MSAAHRAKPTVTIHSSSFAAVAYTVSFTKFLGKFIVLVSSMKLAMFMVQCCLKSQESQIKHCHHMLVIMFHISYYAIAILFAL